MPLAPRTMCLTALLIGTALLAACADTNGASRSEGATSDSGEVLETAPTTLVARPETGTTDDATGEVPCWDPLPEVRAPGATDPAVTIGEPIARAEEPVAFIHHAGSGQGYVLERVGYVRVVGPDGIGDAVLDLSNTLEPGIEEGLLGGAFSPDGEFVYLYMVTDGLSLLVEYAVDPSGRPDGATRREVLRFAQPYENHNGGEVLFGPDCLLYLFTGDGIFDFSGSDPERVALDLSSPLGKVLRLDPRSDGDSSYTVPADNPFVDVDDAFDLVWSYGLRNPWRASFDAATGDLWIGDVGEHAWEEINVAWAADGYGRGVSFGWSAWEGPERRNEDQSATGHREPWLAYDRDRGCSVTAGERYRGSAIPDLAGWFVYADFCWAAIRAVEVKPDGGPGREVFLGEVMRPVDVRAGLDGEIYVVSLDGGIYPLLPPQQRE